LKTEALEGARKGNPVNFCRAFAHHAKITTKLIALRFFLPRQVSRKSAIVDSLGAWSSFNYQARGALKQNSAGEYEDGSDLVRPSTEKLCRLGSAGGSAP